MDESTAGVKPVRRRNDAYNPQYDAPRNPGFRVTRRGFLKGAAVITAGTAVGVGIESGVAQTAFKKTVEAIRELVKPEPTDVYTGELLIPLTNVKIEGQSHENTSRLEGTVNPRHVKKINGKPYNQERFLIVSNGVIVEGKAADGTIEKMLQIRVDDDNFTGQYYSYIGIGEKTQGVIGRLDPSKLIGVSSRNIADLNLKNGITLKGEELNITSFR